MPNYYGRANIRVSKRDINKALQGIEKASKGIGERILKDASKFAAKRAEEYYLGARYDGAVSDISVVAKKGKSGRYTVTATGDAVSFIEFGTGSKVNPSYKNPGTGKPYWFYTLPPGNVFHAGGTYATYERLTPEAKQRRKDELAEAKTYNEESEERYRYNGKEYTRSSLFGAAGSGKFGYFGAYPKDFEDMWTKNITNPKGETFRDWVMNAVISRAEKLSSAPKEQRVTPYTEEDYEEVDKTGSGITKGNPPQYVMEKALQDTLVYLEEKYNAK